MILSLKNIGKLEEATIEINGISVIAGENNTGKSTVGRVLYNIFNSFYDVENNILNQRLRSIFNILLGENWGTVESFQKLKISSERILKSVKTVEGDDKLKKLIFDIIRETVPLEVENNTISNILDKILEILKIDDHDIFNRILTNKFNNEFSNQISNIYTEEEAYIKLKIKNFYAQLDILDNKVSSSLRRIKLNTQSVYLDDPFILDKLPYANRFRPSIGSINRENDLLRKLVYSNKAKNEISEIIIDKKLDNIYEKLNTICDDYLKVEEGNVSYKNLAVKNISTGLKTFVILKTLIKNGWIEENGTIILDEPEIHLHPEWQLIFAEIIVLLQKEFNMHILLTTHSPYFLNAIEVYSAKYNIKDKCKYYMAVNKGNMAVIEDVTENTEPIYAKLARPLQDLENEEYAQ